MNAKKRKKKKQTITDKPWWIQDMISTKFPRIYLSSSGILELVISLMIQFGLQ